MSSSSMFYELNRYTCAYHLHSTLTRHLFSMQTFVTPEESEQQPSASDAIPVADEVTVQIQKPIDNVAEEKGGFVKQIKKCRSRREVTDGVVQDTSFKKPRIVKKIKKCGPKRK